MLPIIYSERKYACFVSKENLDIFPAYLCMPELSKIIYFTAIVDIFQKEI